MSDFAGRRRQATPGQVQALREVVADCLSGTPASARRRGWWPSTCSASRARVL